MKTRWTTLRKLNLLGVILLSVPSLSACSSAATSDYCLLYNPVYYHESDTEETVEQVTDNNVVYLELCVN